MAIFRKEQIPEIPMSSSLPDLQSKKDLPELPSFPNNLKNNNINQEIVKSAITDNFSPEENEVKIEEEGFHEPQIKKFSTSKPSPIPLLPGKQSIMENDRSIELPQISEISDVPNISEQIKPVSINKSSAKVPAIRTHSIPFPKEKDLDVEPIFIRIDKFQLAKKNIEQIKNKVEEMELIIGKIKQVKIKEEEEIKGWSEEIENLKMRISEIDSSVFSQI